MMNRTEHCSAFFASADARSSLCKCGGKKKFRVSKVERVENAILWARYSMFVQELVARRTGHFELVGPSSMSSSSLTGIPPLLPKVNVGLDKGLIFLSGSETVSEVKVSQECTAFAHLQHKRHHVEHELKCHYLVSRVELGNKHPALL